MEKLSPQEIAEFLASANGWSHENETIKKRFEFDTFLDAIAFINRIAPLAEAADHHPELFNVYNTIEIVLTTHDAGGLTTKDLSLAGGIDSVIELPKT